MTAPNIEMIAASLRSCSLEGADGGGGGDHSPPRSRSRSRPRHLAEASDESAGGIMLELNSETALPFHWEQRLDIRTGEIYYINWETGVRTTDDPRSTVSAFSSTNYCYFDDDDDDDEASDQYSRVGTGDEDDYEAGEEEEEDEDDTADSSSLSSASPTQSSMEDPDGVGGGGGGPILVAAGCKACFMYFMVPKRVDACPKCGCPLLHLGRNGCI